jgi:hypothetical protein
VRRGRREGAFALLNALAISIAGCAAPAPTATVTATARPASPTPVATVSPASPGSAGSPTARPSLGSSTSTVVEDPSLLGVLPGTVDGVNVTLEHDAFLDAVADPAFAEHVQRAAFGVAVDGQDLASGVVAELVPDTFSDAFFRDWRDTYDAGACGQSGGVVGNAETEIDGRTVYIGTCAGGLRTYHAWLPERGTIVSAFSIGDRRLGEALMEGLRP